MDDRCVDAIACSLALPCDPRKTLRRVFAGVTNSTAAIGHYRHAGIDPASAAPIECDEEPGKIAVVVRV
jgi:hypothetical protein